VQASDAIAFAVVFGLVMLVVGGLAWLVARFFARPGVVDRLGLPVAGVLRWTVTALLVVAGYARATRASIALTRRPTPDAPWPLALLLDVLASRWLWVVIFLCLAFVLGQVSGRLARRLIRVRYAPTGIRPSRERTLIQLTASTITVVAVIVAVILSLATFMETASLVWLISLFSGRDAGR
jgi:hypothetical protein